MRLSLIHISLGTLVTDDDDVAGMDFPGADGFGRVLFTVKAARGSGVLHHFGRHGALLDHSALRGDVALEHGDSSVRTEGMLQCADDFAVGLGRCLLYTSWKPGPPGQCSLP